MNHGSWGDVSQVKQMQGTYADLLDVLEDVDLFETALVSECKNPRKVSLLVIHSGRTNGLELFEED